MALELVVVAIIHADPGWRAIYQHDGKLLERPVLGWALAEVRGGTARNPQTLDTEARALLARDAGATNGHGALLELAGDECLGYASPGQPAESFTPGVALNHAGRTKMVEAPD